MRQIQNRPIIGSKSSKKINLNLLKTTCFKFGILALIFSLTLVYTLPVSAQTISSTGLSFRPELIIPDEYVIDSPQLSASEIETFLKQRKSALAGRQFFTESGWLNASEIIARASQNSRVSAQFLLVKLQKEQGLIENPNPSQKALDWATGYGICDFCSMSDPALLPFKGFANQVTYSAKQMRKYLDQPERYNFKPGQTVTVSGQTFTIANRVTAALYNYTPHINGNLNIWKLWQRYWFRTFGDGVLLIATDPANSDNKTYWMIRNGQRLQFASRGVFTAYQSSSKKIAQNVSIRELEPYPIGATLKYPEYSIIRGPGGTKYMIRDNQRLAFDSDESFRQAGFNPDEVEDISQDDLDAIPLGPMITRKDIYPTGTVVREIETNKYFYLEQNIRYLIPTTEILNTVYAGRNIVRMSRKQLAGTTQGPDKFYPAGTVIKSDNRKDKAVYLVTEKGLQAFTSMLDFVQFGYKDKDIKIVSAKLIASQPKSGIVVNGTNVEAPAPDAPLGIATN